MAGEQMAGEVTTVSPGIGSGLVPSPRPILCEICVDTVAGVRAARRAGADRVELAVELDADGLTPPEALVREALLAAGPMPVHVLVRPRVGDFVFSAEEIGHQLATIDLLRDFGVAGLAWGALTPDGTIDLVAARAVRSAAEGLSLTFHRAFDHTADLRRGLAQLIDLGFDRVLTSGGARRAEEGVDRLADLVEAARDRISIMAAGSLRAHNVARVVAASHVPEVHARDDPREDPQEGSGEGSSAPETVGRPPPPPVGDDASRPASTPADILRERRLAAFIAAARSAG